MKVRSAPSEVPPQQVKPSAMLVQFSSEVNSLRASSDTGSGHEVQLQRMLQFMEDVAQRSTDWNYTMDEEEVEALNVIRTFLDGLQADALISLNEDQLEVDAARDAIQDCTDDTITGLGEAASLKTDLVDPANETHQEKRLAGCGVSAPCDDYDNFRQGDLQDGRLLCFPEASDPLSNEELQNINQESPILEEAEACLKRVENWFTELYELYLACVAQRASQAGASNAANTDQLDFEEAVCSWGTKLDSTCNTQVTCRNHTITFRNLTHEHVPESEQARKADMYAVEKILCYFEVFDVNNTQKPIKLDECIAMEPDLSMYDIEYHEIPNEQPCSKLEDLPCEESWIQREYIDMSWYSNWGGVESTCPPMASCTVCPLLLG